MAFLCLKLQSQNVGVVKLLPRNTPSSLRDHRAQYRRREGAPVAGGLSHRSQQHVGHVQDNDRGSEDPIRRAFPTRYDRWRLASGRKCAEPHVTYPTIRKRCWIFPVEHACSSSEHEILKKSHVNIMASLASCSKLEHACSNFQTCIPKLEHACSIFLNIM